VKINLHELLLENRRESVVTGESSFSEKFAWKIWKQASMNRRLMNQGTAPIKNWLVNKMLKGWTNQRAPIVFPKKTFNELWKESQKK
jgi:L-lactate dehydrogenase complex protein LldF